MASAHEESERAAVPGTAAFGKFMRVLQSAADADGGTSIARLARDLDLPRTTVHRIVSALLAEGMLSEEPSGQLVLGPRLVSLAFRSWDGSALRRASEPHLLALRDALDETVHLAVHDGAQMVYIDKLESRRTVRMASRIGTSVPLHSSSVGKAYLAALSPLDFEAALAGLTLTAQTPGTLTDAEAVRSDIAETRARGYSLDLEENEVDICCYGHALLGPHDRILGCISVSLPTYRFKTVPRADILAAMRACVSGIAESTGARATGAGAG